MSALSLRLHSGRRLSREALVTSAAMAGWTAFAAAGFLGLAPARVAPLVFPVSLLVPLVLVGRVLLWRDPPPVHMQWAAGWSAVVAAAFLLTPMVIATPRYALAIPGVLAGATLCGRFPATATAGVLFLSGTYGSVRAFAGLPAGQVIDALLLGLWLSMLWTYLLKGRDRPVWLWPGVVAVAFYAALSAASIVTAQDLTSGLLAFRTTSWLVLAFLLVGYAWWRPGTREVIAKAALATAAFVGSYACFRYAVGPAAEEVVVARSDRTNILDGQLRLIGSFLSAKALAAWCAVAVPFVVAMALSIRGRWRFVGVLAAVTCSIALVATEVRTGVVGLVTGVALVILLFQASRAFPGPQLGITATAILGALVIGAGLFAFTAGRSDTATDRYAAILEPSRDAAFQARLVRWRTVLADIDQRPFGHGIGTSGRIQRERGRFTNISAFDVDNSYLQIAFEQGLAVMGLFIAASLALLFGLARRAIRTTSRQAAGIAIGASGALWSYLTILPTGSYIEGLGSVAVWVLVGLGVGQFSGAEWADSDPRRPAG